MTDANDAENLQSDEVAATRGREQGLGVGARELEAQRDPGGVRAADEEPAFEDGVSVQAGDEEAFDESVSVLGAADEDDEDQA